MDALVQRYLTSGNGFQYNRHSATSLPEPNREKGYKFNHDSQNSPVLSNGSVSSSSQSPTEGSSPEDGDYPDPILKYISQMLMEEEDLANKPCMLSDCLALQATEKSLYDVLNGNKSSLPEITSSVFVDQNDASLNSHSTWTGSSQNSFSPVDLSNFVQSDYVHDLSNFKSSLTLASCANDLSQSISPINIQSFSSSNGFCDGATNSLAESSVSSLQLPSLSHLDLLSRKVNEGNDLLPNASYFNYNLQLMEKTAAVVTEVETERNERNNSPDGSRGKKNNFSDDSDDSEDSRLHKQQASYIDEGEPLEMYDKVLLCATSHSASREDPHRCPLEDGLQNGWNKLQLNAPSKGSNRGRPRGSKKHSIRKEVVDLRSLLIQCAQAVSSYDNRTADELLKRIRQHSSPQGDGMERLAHYFADALEARLAGTGTASYTAITTRSRRISAAAILKAYQVYVTACPFRKLSHMFANKWIRKQASGARKIHIIDFGILYGFQWPCLIQDLSMRADGPPELHITGIDLPQRGFRPAERVEDTGRRLAKYCKRFNVPFKFDAVAKKWESIKLEDLNIEKNDFLVVNCLYRLGTVPDETVVANSPRDAVLNLIKKIKPDIFIHGVVNGTYNAPFFVTRFREALFHFSSLFDIFEATVPRENQDRVLFEKEIFGRDAMNIIACEGTERVERPETYKQWQVRNLRAGFRQIPLDQEIVKNIRHMVKKCYHKDFSVDEDGNWMLQGWKGRVLHALSCWKPT